MAQSWKHKNCYWMAALLFSWTLVLADAASKQLRFSDDGLFKILQVADMHFGDGKYTPCVDVLPDQIHSCSDLNTSSFISRLIETERPHLLIFTGDNIYGFNASNAAHSLNAAFAPAISSNIPWAAVLGNHDQESTLSREGVMKHIAGMKNTVSELNPPGFDGIDGFGNYNLEVSGAQGSNLHNISVLNLYLLDSGGYSTVNTISGYGWIKPSQQYWFQRTSKELRRAYIRNPDGQRSIAPGLAYFHIPLPEFARFDSSSFTGVKQEGISSANVNSGFFTTMLEAGDVKAVFTGHDHLNDFCGKLFSINLCYAGGFGYHANGKAGWARRARVVLATLEAMEQGGWGEVQTIKTWKRLDDKRLSTVDAQVLWSRSSDGWHRRKKIGDEATCPPGHDLFCHAERRYGMDSSSPSVLHDSISQQERIQPPMAQPGINQPIREKPMAQPTISPPLKEKSTAQPGSNLPRREKPIAQPNINQPVREKPIAEPRIYKPIREKPMAQPTISPPLKEKPTAQPGINLPRREENSVSEAEDRADPIESEKEPEVQKGYPKGFPLLNPSRRMPPFDQQESPSAQLIAGGMIILVTFLMIIFTLR